jgi:hypothetical protein
MAASNGYASVNKLVIELKDQVVGNDVEEIVKEASFSWRGWIHI